MAPWWPIRAKRRQFLHEHQARPAGSWDCRLFLTDGHSAYTGRVEQIGKHRLSLFCSGVSYGFDWSTIERWAWVEKAAPVTTSLNMESRHE